MRRTPSSGLRPPRDYAVATRPARGEGSSNRMAWIHRPSGEICRWRNVTSPSEYCDVCGEHSPNCADGQPHMASLVRLGFVGSLKSGLRFGAIFREALFCADLFGTHTQRPRRTAPSLAILAPRAMEPKPESAMSFLIRGTGGLPHELAAKVAVWAVEFRWRGLIKSCTLFGIPKIRVFRSWRPETGAQTRDNSAPAEKRGKGPAPDKSPVPRKMLFSSL